MTSNATERTATYRLDGRITLLAPMSHIGSSDGPDAQLAETMILGPDGEPVECFCYSGNAFRGQLRDRGAEYLLERLGQPRLPLDVFYLLFSGGSIGGDQSIDIDQARMYRRALPLLSILGSGVGNQIMEGKLKMGAMWPLVWEAQRLLPEWLRDAEAPEWGRWTAIQSFSRMDDAKNENLREHCLTLPGNGQEKLLLDDSSGGKKTKKGDGNKEPHQQMRYTVEVVSPGAQFWQRIDLVGVTEIELGAFVSCLHAFANAPYIGGMSRLGFGLIEAAWEYSTPEDLERRHFCAVNDGRCLPGRLAKDAQDAYDAHVQTMYDRYLTDKGDEIREVLRLGTA